MNAAEDLGASGLRGFVSAGKLRSWAKSESLEGFCEEFSSPCLRVIGEPVSGGLSHEPVLDISDGKTLFQDDQARADPRECERYYGQVGFLAKRPGNPFPNMISVGRAPTTDLSLAITSVSKMHGYFLCMDGSWQVCDQSSTNGVFVNGERLTQRVPKQLEDGDVIKFGLDIRFQFLFPATLYTLLREEEG